MESAIQIWCVHSSGKPSEKHVYQDGEAAFQALLSRFHLTPDKIVLYRQSIGSVPTVDLAVRHQDVAGVILHSSIASALRTVFLSLKRSLSCDSFPKWDPRWLQIKFCGPNSRISWGQNFLWRRNKIAFLRRHAKRRPVSAPPPYWDYSRTKRY